jgi:hypothetical protein
VSFWSKNCYFFFFGNHICWVGLSFIDWILENEETYSHLKLAPKDFSKLGQEKQAMVGFIC